MNIPGIHEILTVVKQMPVQFERLIDRLDKVVTLLEEQNDILRSKN